jgi:hypothetical protein
MHITVQREALKDDRTLGELLIDGQHFCWTLEDAVRDRKIQNETAIPAGVYEAVVTWSNRFGKPLPMLLNVPNFTAIRFHEFFVREFGPRVSYQNFRLWLRTLEVRS